MDNKISNDKENILISIILLIPDSFYLVPLTIESIIAQENHNYEIIIMEKGLSRHEIIFLKEFSDKITKVVSTKIKNPSSVINQAASYAKGKYINILYPGDEYISPKCLGNVTKVLEKDNLDLLYAPYLHRDGKNAPRVINRKFSNKVLIKGQDITNIESCFIKNETFLSLDGFDETLAIRGDFDFLCKIFFEVEDSKISFINRILVDSQYHRLPHQTFFLYTKDTFRIIYRYFGLLKTISWWLLQDHFKIIGWWLNSFRQYFVKP
jgi:glycosyltransferase involved in cell wall biosynthesis